MLVERMTKTMSTESIFSRKYGLLGKQEAHENAKRIEELCFASADEHFKNEPDGDGSSAVQLYAKESSKMMLEVLRKGPRTTAELEAPVDDTSLVSADAPRVLADTVLDISGGERAFIEADEAKELLSPLTKPGNSYKRICFSNRSFGIGAANVAGPILESVKNQLTEVDISDFVAGRPEDEALDVMRIFSKALEGSVLRYLNISDNALGEKGVRAFSELLKSQESLEELYVMNDGISEEAAKALSELIPATEKLKVLHFHNNMTGDEGAMYIAEMVKRSPNVESFRCSATRIGSDGGVALSEALGTCTRLKKLDLRDNLFGVDAGLALSKTLPKLPDLVELYLSDLNLENKGTIAIAKALEQSAPQLEVLEIAGNEINAKAAPDLAKCLAAMQSLKKLTLAENELKDDGAVIIAKSLEDGHIDLKELDVSVNMLQRVGARCFARAVANKPAFELLNINGNFISGEGIDEVEEILKAGKKPLKVLGPLDENEPDGEPDDDDEEVEDNEDELNSKLQSVKVEQDD
ncbi:RAN GTPase-activating protein 1 [Zea mays]|nr:RAN GTPase-activating protein 2 [Zea mays]PWZ22180.1 RAN GTPase-activating protein 1 [Zea mays]